MRQKIIDLIIETANDLGEDQIGVSSGFSENTVLFGREGVLDSMGLVTLIIAVEQAIEDEFDIPVGLADEKAMSQTTSPYRTVGTLADYAASQMQSG